MIEDITQNQNTILSALESVTTLQELETLQLQHLSRKSPLKQLGTAIKSLNKDEKKEAGKALNNALRSIKQAFEAKREALTHAHIQNMHDTEWFDVTLPAPHAQVGHLHPITTLRERAEDIFMRMGFEIHEPRAIDTDYNVFEALNIPSGHPARDMWDTFWTDHGYIPITHTSAMQHRLISEHDAPLRAVVPGRCFRHEATDATHGHTFYQIEGVYVDKGITLTDLIGTLKAFLSAFYEQEVRLKIQPSYFPFVEPALEIMIGCVVCNGDTATQCSTCRNKRWIELVPAGPIHPNVLRMAGKDPDVYSGFAWGLGLDRLVMIKYGIEDLRLFHGGNMAFLEQF